MREGGRERESVCLRPGCGSDGDAATVAAVVLIVMQFHYACNDNCKHHKIKLLSMKYEESFDDNG